MVASEQFGDVFAQLPADSFDKNCPTRPVMAQVTGRWGALIIAALVPGPMRFSGLHRHIGGISQKMLSQYLKSVVRYGLVERLVEPTVPPQVTYSLTPLGRSLAQQLCALLSWFHANTPALEAAQQRYDAADSPAR
ncbi:MULTISPECIES: winged helix-turn-helix transcriptional regulator [Streptomyces]|uniref:Helix-turn-helix transcriptional regulator n=3 Tax=Streptomyces TaxID=1883 RepID=A0ABS7WCQ1_STROV|nr:MULTISPECIES: helix-turn-helix domain-containing protein [Streptomyces]MBZ6093666.1 helix-turn-helix transcriptional regulator [Streptomyces olivaceus]MBZ6099659.1 helix-turn-helix transcriptional regulator [Streptomyces olivaceus]MBZ6114839.1 helix-turn-helix transcriptional regulator [Streptomyces olivaceus]MBZ6121856.1 helix-turn-helix transcriptional regulator [Streptomyces olivaceus]MBZ6128840.1 helix-turn-helix transcriptional regulator [Streptomyces olivaceus]